MMNRMTTAFAALICAAGLGWGAVAITSAPSVTTDAAKLHPQQSIVFVQWDGSKAHAEAIQETAQYKALVESGLYDYVIKMVRQALPAIAKEVGGRGAEGDLKMAEHIFQHLTKVFESGLSLSVTAGPENQLAPMATLVLHEFGGQEDLLEQVLRVAGIPGQDAESKLVSGRSVKTLMIPRTPGFELSWFSEGGHLVVTAGPNASGTVIAIADGNAPNVTSSEAWQTYCDQDAGFEVASVGWVQFGELIERFGETPLPIPQVDGPRTVNQFVDALGLSNLKHVASQFGYQGEACMARSYIVAPGEKKGLLKLTQQPVFTINDLPPIPADASAFFAFGLDAAGSYDVTLEVIQNVLELLPEEASEEFAKAKQMLDRTLGLDLRDDLLAGLGDVHCVYADSSGGFFGLGFGAAFQVADEQKLNAAVNHLANLAQDLIARERTPVPIEFQRSEQEGHQLLSLPISAWSPTLSITDKWMVAGIQPQSVRAFFMRQQGKLPKWEPNSEHQTAFKELPKRFSSLTVDDPRASVGVLYNFLPMVNSVAHTMIPDSRAIDAVRAADLPVMETVVAPLFPNVGVSVPSENGLEFIRRQSLPIGPMPSVESGAAVPVLLALLLPAVQQAREAARRTQSKNNLKQIALAMHNYHDVYNRFPSGTVAGTELPPEERLSFFYSLLPFIEQAAMYDQLRRHEKLAFDSDESSRFTSMMIPTLQHPGQPSYVSGGTSYIGISGVGPDAASLEHKDPKAGIFGYDRVTRIRDIMDGTSNTVMTSETSDQEIPWAQGGVTLRGFSQQPYINGPDGIGGPSPGGCNMGMADGSVRFVSEYVDPAVMEALATKAGGERIGQF